MLFDDFDWNEKMNAKRQNFTMDYYTAKFNEPFSLDVDAMDFWNVNIKNILGYRCTLKPYTCTCSFGELEWISINLSKSAVFSLQTLENNLTSP